MNDIQKYENAYGVLNKNTNKEIKVEVNISKRKLINNQIIFSGKIKS